MLAVTIWSLNYALSLMSSTLPIALFWDKIVYLGTVVIGPAWLAFTLQYTGRGKWLVGRNIALLGIIPLVTLALVWTNENHSLIYTWAGFETVGSFLVLNVSYGPWFWFHIAYTYALLLLGTILLFQTLFGSSKPRLYRGQFVVVLIGVLAPWVVSALDLAELGPFSIPIDLAPFALTLTGLTVTWGLFGFRFLDIIPVARDAVVDGIRDGMIVSDLQDRIIDLNPSAKELIGTPAAQAIGKQVGQMLPFWAEISELRQEAIAIQTETIWDRDGKQYHYEIRISPLTNRHGRLTGQLIFLRDITERKRTELLNRTLFRITNAINTTANLDELYASIHDTLGAVIDTTNFYIALYHKATNSISFPYFEDEMDSGYDYIRDFTATNSLTGEVILSRAPLFLTQEMLLERAEKNQILGTVPKIWLGVPLKIKAEVIGVMAVQSYYDAGRFKKTDLAILNAVAGQIAIVIDRRRTEEELQRNREAAVQFSEYLTALQEITIQLSKTESTDDLCLLAVQLGRSHLGFERVSIWFIEEHLGIMRGSFGTNERGELRDERKAQIEFRQEGLAWHLFSQKEPMALIEHSSLGDHLGREVGEGDNAVAALWDGDEVIGVICVDNLLTGQPITENQLEVLRLYAITLGHLITRKRVDEELKKHRDHLEELVEERTTEFEIALQETTNLLEAAKDILSANSVEEICENLISNLKQLVSADRSTLFLVDYERREILLNMVRGNFDGEVPITYDELMAGIFGIVYRERRPILSVHPEDGVEPDATKARRYRDDAGPLIVCPLMTKDNLIGQFTVVNRLDQRVFTQHEMDLLMNLATQAAAAIENLRLFENMQQAKEEAVSANKELEAVNKELEAFAHSVSHDLRAPLRHIDGFIEILEKRTRSLLDGQSLHFMENISDAAKRMGILIDDLLAFSRMGRQEIVEKQVDLAVLTKDVIRELTPDTQDRTVHWKVADLPTVSGDQAMLRLVLVNLISNALKFTSPLQEAEIEIGCILDSDTEVEIFVRDNGVGFDMNFADKLFGVFQRLHHTDEFEGTGIGLANVRRIISRHGGRTWADGKVDHGATFYFSLPISK
jgi:PAS domain S-box-containing protein